MGGALLRGTYNFTSVPAEAWEVLVTSGGQSTTVSATVTASGTTTANATL
jgi:hypothetical protein